MKIVGLYNWHDGGYCVLEDGIVKEHIEIERYTRLKEDGGDSLKYLKDIHLKGSKNINDDIDVWVSSHPISNLEKNGISTFSEIPKDKIKFYSHHLCHAAHAFFSSNFEKSIILTADSAGMEEDGSTPSICGYYAEGLDIQKIFQINNNQFSLGSLWGRCTRFIFKLSAGYPRGHQAGSVMAMAAFGNPDVYYEDMKRMSTTDFNFVSYTPPGYVRGKYVPPEEDVTHPYLDKYRKIAEKSEQEKMNLAASLQRVTEEHLFHIISHLLQVLSNNNIECDNICLAGGVSLNSVFTGKIKEKFKNQLNNVFVPPVPYDGGLSIGACQYHWHSVLRKPRNYDQFVTPYLGVKYERSDIINIIKENKNITYKENFNLKECVDLLVDDKIVSVFQGGSESGRRALGNRSILASPISKNMKSLINEKVKHRQWFRPFAPTILEEYGEEWFENFIPSPYMGFVFKFKKDKLGLAPAVEHHDSTARAQSVNQNQNKNYYDLIKLFHEKTGVPMILNTSFNDREPIVETPENAINCFLGTDIDYLYFADEMILVSKNC